MVFDTIEEELEYLGIDAKYKPILKEGSYCYGHGYMLEFKNQRDLNLYKMVGVLKEDSELEFRIKYLPRL